MATVKTPTANCAGSLAGRLRAYQTDPVLRGLRPKGVPWACEDEESRMGESTLHTLSADILLYGLIFHFTAHTDVRVFGNLNLYFTREHPNLYLTPDVMAVRPTRSLPANLNSYRIGAEGPTPELVAEVLSPRTYQEGDLTSKPLQYAELGVGEYLIADVTGDMLKKRLVLLRRRGATWREHQDADGGITSRLGFRVVIEDDGQLRVVDARTGKRYARPDEAQAVADRVAALEAELNRLRGPRLAAGPKDKKTKGRRRQP